ncbi:unnamed protein product, partial [Urochloa humidicola]
TWAVLTAYTSLRAGLVPSPHATGAALSVAPFPVAPASPLQVSKKRLSNQPTTMALAALREASRCLASRKSAAAARPMLLAHSRGITYKLFIGGLSQFATEDSLAESFSRYGQVIEATIVTDKVTNRPKGFGFVKFASQEEANTAREEMNGKVLNGRVIYVDIAKAKMDRDADARPIARGRPS